MRLEELLQIHNRCTTHSVPYRRLVHDGMLYGIKKGGHNNFGLTDLQKNESNEK